MFCILLQLCLAKLNAVYDIFYILQQLPLPSRMQCKTCCVYTDSSVALLRFTADLFGGHDPSRNFVHCQIILSCLSYSGPYLFKYKKL